MSTNELQELVKQDLIEQIKKNPETERTEIISFVLIQKSIISNEYQGVLTVKEPDYQSEIFNGIMTLLSKGEETINLDADFIEKTYEVEVIYDGESYSYKLIDDNG
jgi:hypothetical protein